MLASDLMVAVAHQVEHRIVAPEVAGSRPVSHPTSRFSPFGVPSQSRAEIVPDSSSEGANGSVAQIKERGQSVPPNLAFQAWVVRPSMATCNAPLS